MDEQNTLKNNYERNTPLSSKTLKIYEYYSGFGTRVKHADVLMDKQDTSQAYVKQTSP